MFPVLTASSITLTLPVEDSHIGHNCFSMGLGRGRGGGREGGRGGGEGECVRLECLYLHVERTGKCRAETKKDIARPKLAFDGSD